MTWPNTLDTVADATDVLDCAISALTRLSPRTRRPLVEARARLAKLDPATPGLEAGRILDGSLMALPAHDRETLRTHIDRASDMMGPALAERRRAEREERAPRLGSCLDLVTAELVLQISRWGAWERWGRALPYGDGRGGRAFAPLSVVEAPSTRAAAERTTIFGEVALFELGSADADSVARGLCLLSGNGMEQHLRYVLDFDEHHVVYREPESYLVRRRDRLTDGSFERLLTGLIEDMLLFAHRIELFGVGESAELAPLGPF